MPGQNLIFPTYDVVAEPTDGDPTVVAILTGVSTIYDGQPVYLHVWVVVDPDADATGIGVNINRTDIDGEQVGNGVFMPLTLDADAAPAVTAVHYYIEDFPGNAQNATYVAVVNVADASATSGIQNVYLEARVG